MMLKYFRDKLLVTLVLVNVFFFSSAFFKGQASKIISYSNNGINHDSDSVANLSDYDMPFIMNNTNWADSVLETLTLDEKIAQLFMVAAYSNKNQKHVNKIVELVERYKIGGLIFFQGGPLRQAQLTNLYQSKAKTPLLISIDGEWGLAMRLDSTVKYPRQMMLGAIQNDDFIYDMGVDIAEQCRRIGIHVNLAPVVDVNNNPNNPVINSRSFGEDKFNVARKGIAYMRGMQDNHLLTTAKHFPGHGDTDTDSHKALPVIRHTKVRLQNIELYPFQEMIKQGLGGMMVAHLYIPSLDSTKNTASTLSKPIVTELLKEEMGFTGLTFTDALNMKGVSAYFKPGEVDLKALMAGNDVLLFAEDVPVAIKKIKEAVSKGVVSEHEIEQRCKKILYAKQWVGLNNQKPVELTSLYRDLNQPKYELTKRKLIENSLTLLNNKNKLLPLQSLDTLRIASVAIGDEKVNSMQRMLSTYTAVTHFNLPKKPTKSDADSLLAKLKAFNLIIVGIHRTNNRPSKNFGITPEAVNLAAKIDALKPCVLSVFANPYSLNKFYGAENTEALIMAYEDSKLSNEYVGQLIFGGISAKGKLPVTASPHYILGHGIATDSVIRLKYSIPEETNISTSDLDGIENLVNLGMDEQAFPGCQIVVAKQGKVIYNRSFGHHTYEGKRQVKKDDIYDLASITKIASSVVSAMKLDDENKFNLDYNLCDYLPSMVDTTHYMNMNMRAMLAHQARLISWIPFYKKTFHKGEPRFDVYSLAQSKIYPHRVADNFYIHKDYSDQIMKRILSTGLRKQEGYKYSDLGYYFMKKIIQKQTGSQLDQYVQKTFYNPLGMTTTGYLPRTRFELNRIVPTEYDLLYRRQLVHGDVHDPGAAMLGGVGGHAGVFSSANDLAKMMQMFLNGGHYGGARYIDEETIDEYTQVQFASDNNRRGAGFDKPAAHGSPGPTCDCISFDSFGHSGFTGTLAWADPKEEVVFVFLSNRVYPNASNRKLITMNTRSKIMQVIYEAIEKGKEEPVN